MINYFLKSSNDGGIVMFYANAFTIEEKSQA